MATTSLTSTAMLRYTKLCSKRSAALFPVNRLFGAAIERISDVSALSFVKRVTGSSNFRAGYQPINASLHVLPFKMTQSIPFSLGIPELEQKGEISVRLTRSFSSPLLRTPSTSHKPKNAQLRKRDIRSMSLELERRVRLTIETGRW